MTAPDWLTERGGALKLGSDGETWYVLFAGQPNYSLVATPAEGKFDCVIRQTNKARASTAPACTPPRKKRSAAASRTCAPPSAGANPYIRCRYHCQNRSTPSGTETRGR